MKNKPQTDDEELIITPREAQPISQSEYSDMPHWNIKEEILKQVQKESEHEYATIEPTPYKYEVVLKKRKYGLELVTRLLDLIP